MELQDFICPVAPYRGEAISSHQEFNAHLQIFCCRASLICSLQTSGKLSPAEALQKLMQLWEELQPYTSLIEDEYRTFLAKNMSSVDRENRNNPWT
ncbi:DUF7219 family protein [Fischerella thermalis]|uniref:DUF7219 family protein n=1 Tax=Fischerella thermalis TaxID=372787 RepID=UPI0015E0C2FD|nr:hypothetical protein [Fischerella thermalis]